MLVTLAGSVTAARLVQERKALAPMVVRLSGSVMLARLVQPEKA